MSTTRADALSESEIAELESLEKSATPGPWTGVKTFVENGRAYLCANPKRLIFASDGDQRIQPGSAKEADADLCAAARNALPRLLTASRRALELEQRVAGLVEGLAKEAKELEASEPSPWKEERVKRGRKIRAIAAELAAVLEGK